LGWILLQGRPEGLPADNLAAYIDTAILGARPKAIAALLRYFRDLDTAEEAFQEACLRALKTWPHKGPPRNPTAWLIMVGRNAALDAQRRIRSTEPLPEADGLTDTRDDFTPERLDESHYGDDILRLLFMCGHPTSPSASCPDSRSSRLRKHSLCLPPRWSSG
jgi:RNA polymerase sigma-70 factor (ECF subfamily)